MNYRDADAVCRQCFGLLSRGVPTDDPDGFCSDACEEQYNREIDGAGDPWHRWYPAARDAMKVWGIRRVPVDAYREQYAAGASPQEAADRIRPMYDKGIWACAPRGSR